MAEVNADVQEIIHRFLRRLNQEGIHVEEAYLYGSYAKRTEDKWSDIDVAIISPDFSRDRFEEGVRLMQISSDVDPHIEPVPFTPDTFVDENPLVWEIKKTGILIKVK